MGSGRRSSGKWGTSDVLDARPFIRYVFDGRRVNKQFCLSVDYIRIAESTHDDEGFNLFISRAIVVRRETRCYDEDIVARFRGG